MVLAELKSADGRDEAYRSAQVECAKLKLPRGSMRFDAKSGKFGAFVTDHEVKRAADKGTADSTTSA